MWRTTTQAQRRRSRKLLSRTEAARNQCARGNGGHRKYTLVRAANGGIGFRTVDRRPTPDSSAAGPKAENRSPGCAPAAEVAPGRSLSLRVGAEPGKSRPSATAL